MKPFRFRDDDLWFLDELRKALGRKYGKTFTEAEVVRMAIRSEYQKISLEEKRKL